MVQISTSSVFANNIIGPLAGIADLDMALFGDQWRLFATSEIQSSVSVFDVLGLQEPSLSAPAQAVTGGQGSVTDLNIVNTGAGKFAVFSGEGSAVHNAYEITVDGSFGPGFGIAPVSGQGGALTAVSTVPVGGQNLVATSQSDQGGFTVSSVDADLTLTNIQNIGIPGGDISDVEMVVVDGANITIALDKTRNEILSYAEDENGTLTPADSLGVMDGLGLVGPEILRVVDVAGQTFGIVAATDSSSISVFEITQTGEMIARDHVIDGQGTRFASVSELEIVESAGRAFVLTAGADDGITLMELLPDGRLIHHATMEDDDSVTLQDVSGLVGQVQDGVLHVFVASKTEAGLTELTFDLGTAGMVQAGGTGDETLTGGAGDDVLFGGHGAGNDVLYGNEGDDILVAGHGVDRLIGGAGADVFVFGDAHQGGQIDDFNITRDFLDLSGWASLQDVSQLVFSSNGNRLDIGFQGYSLTIYSHDGSTLDVNDLMARITINPSHSMISEAPTTGGNNPVHHGTSGDDVLFGDDGEDFFVAGEGADTFIGGDAFDLVSYEDASNGIVWDKIFKYLNRGDVADDAFNSIEGLKGTGFADLIKGHSGDNWLAGDAGNDSLAGRAGSDQLFGGDGDDWINGGRGHDTVEGGAGDDFAKGKRGHDHLIGGDGNDELRGGGGRDPLDGGAGDDVLAGSRGADEFRFTEGDDRILDFNADQDLLFIDQALLDNPNMTAQDILNLYGEDLGQSVRLDFGLDAFGDTNMITLDGVRKLDDLADSLFTF